MAGRELRAWLATMRLESYYPAFAAKGYEFAEDVLADVDSVDQVIPLDKPGHRVRMKRMLRQLGSTTETGKHTEGRGAEEEEAWSVPKGHVVFTAGKADPFFKGTVLHSSIRSLAMTHGSLAHTLRTNTVRRGAEHRSRSPGVVAKRTPGTRSHTLPPRKQLCTAHDEDLPVSHHLQHSPTRKRPSQRVMSPTPHSRPLPPPSSHTCDDHTRVVSPSPPEPAPTFFSVKPSQVTLLSLSQAPPVLSRRGRK
eukprot:Sspe_Gene.24010::Locus_9427_Transcript_1_1_Confidence_1.000_Length_945::g.24010::m.24010